MSLQASAESQVSPDVQVPADVTVILVSYNSAHLFDRLFSTLHAASRNVKLQIIAVDNASRDGSASILREKFPFVDLIETTSNVGFARANNIAVKRATGRYVLLLNTDAFVAPDTIDRTLEFMDTHPKCGVLGVKLVGEDRSLQPSCRYFPTPLNIFLSQAGLQGFFPQVRSIDDMTWDHASVRQCDWVPGCYYLIRREVIAQVGLFDPRYFLYYEEVDHCRAVRQAGWDVVYYPFTQVIHLWGESAGQDANLNSGRQISALNIESELLYLRKHFGVSGLLSTILLTLLQIAILSAKYVIRPRNKGRWKDSIASGWTMLKLLVGTRAATRATR